MPYVSKDMQCMRTWGAEPSYSEFHLKNTDSAATINNNTYITDADERNVRIGDNVLHVNTTTYEKTMFTANAIDSQGRADLTDGTVVSTGTDTD